MISLGVKIKNNYCIWNHHHLDLDHDIFNFQSGMPSSNGTENEDLEAHNPETIRFPRIYWKLLLMGSEIRRKQPPGMYKNLVNHGISTTNLIWSYLVSKISETSTVYDVSFCPLFVKASCSIDRCVFTLSNWSIKLSSFLCGWNWAVPNRSNGSLCHCHKAKNQSWKKLF